MAIVSVFDMQGNEVGKMELNDAVFAAPINEHLLHLAVVAQLANRRQGTKKALTRAEVSGGGRKPWRQKGTGHARQGSIRSPQWKGGLQEGPEQEREEGGSQGGSLQCRRGSEAGRRGLHPFR